MEKTDELIKYLRDWLEARDWDPKKLADCSGISSPSIYNLLNGKTKHPKPETLQKIAAITGDSPEFLYGKAGISITPTTPRSERIRQLLAMWDELSETDQDTLMVMARGLREERRKDERVKNRPEGRVRRKP